jgi:hypothetical protein
MPAFLGNLGTSGAVLKRTTSRAEKQPAKKQATKQITFLGLKIVRKGRKEQKVLDAS